MADATTDVCIVGAGPAGLTLALELVRRGARVTVLEQRADFARTFRGESLSPDSVWLLRRMGLFERLRGSCLEMRALEITDAGRTVLRADFADFPYPQRAPVELPQSVLLAELAKECRRHRGFRLLHRVTAVGLLGADRVTGVHCQGPDGRFETRAALTVAADGRYSRVRDLSGLTAEKTPLGRDVVWLRLPRPDVWDAATYRIRIDAGRHALFLPTHPDDVRVGLNIPKGGVRKLRAEGLAGLHTRLDALAPELSELVRAGVREWGDTSVLDLFTTVVPRWSRPGLALVGDAAHTLSPILGQGVNHALADAVTLAPLIAPLVDADPAGAAVREALLAFQREREPLVARSRALQLRQERLFALDRPLAAAGRRALYRAVDRSAALKLRVLAPAYFQLQSREEPSRRQESVRDRGPDERSPDERSHHEQGRDERGRAA
ncbi:FAD-dependent oxidoreductase [Streptacidiphilus neutrinimicus]|uniref:FAD-dependent oxidoreductase n=1 Tax=Streptacidiphilus neutrinimicus TaxID=105420 RepID=UPI0005A7BC51|nr:FAD-dependent oxidoreductase [Streptacidiphilus neutrinimicus]